MRYRIIKQAHSMDTNGNIRFAYIPQRNTWDTCDDEEYWKNFADYRDDWTEKEAREMIEMDKHRQFIKNYPKEIIMVA